MIAKTLTVGGLTVAGVLHAAWAMGSTWPRDNQDALADLVVGQPPFPSAAATWTVAALLAIAAIGVAAAGPEPTPARRPARLITAVTAAALLVRGVGGLSVSAVGLGDATKEFRTWDLLLYSPLCLALGVGAACVWRAARRDPIS